MDISLDQAIDIYAKALCAWKKDHAHTDARNAALAYKALGDEEGFEAWSRVADKAAALMRQRDNGIRRRV